MIKTKKVIWKKQFLVVSKQNTIFPFYEKFYFSLEFISDIN